MPHDVTLNLAVTLFQFVAYDILPFVFLYWFKRILFD